MRYAAIAILIAAGLPSTLFAADVTRPEAELVEVRKIWDQGNHNAFTDLIRFRDRWWCCFREGVGHVGGDGAIRVITSADGRDWESASLLTEKDIDLRDPKFSIVPDGRLMLVAGGSVYRGTTKLQGRQPRVMFSDDGRQWTEPRRVLAEGDWLWRVTWHEGTAYGVSYRATSPDEPASEWTLALYRSRDGLDWQRVTDLEVPGQPNETTLRFLASGEMAALVRREAGESNGGWIGLSKPPYTQWTWRDTSFRLGGPDFIQLADASLWACTRQYNPKVCTVIARLDLQGKLTPVLTLPSGGDTSYAGLAHHDGLLWVSYYSSHEGKTSIYLAKVRLADK